MIAITSHTAAAIALRAAEGSWIVFLQAISPVGGLGPIKIEGMTGAQLVPRLNAIRRDNAYEIQLIGLMPTQIDPREHARALQDEYRDSETHDGWFEPTGDVLAFIQHSAQDAITELLSDTHPTAYEETSSDRPVDIDEIANILGVSVSTIRRMVESGRIPYFRLHHARGRPHRFIPKDVIATLSREPK